MQKKRKVLNHTEIYLEIEISRIQREKAAIVLNKSIFLYFSFMSIGVLGFLLKYFDSFLLNLMIIIGIIVLFTGTLPYLLIAHKEEEKIKHFLSELKGGKDE